MNARARWLFRLNSLLAAGGVAVAIAAMTVALRAAALHLPGLDRLAAACRSWLPHITLSEVLVLALAGMSVAVIQRVVVSAWRAVRDSRAFLAGLETIEVIDDTPTVRVVRDDRAVAFCAGLLRPSIYVSDAALARLARDELEAVLCHERDHAARRDPLRLVAAQALAEGLFFLPALQHLRSRYAAVAEMAADEAAIASSVRPGALASAMLTFGRLESLGAVGVSPERVDHLLGMPSRWQLRLWGLLGAAVTLAGLAALVALAAWVTRAGELSVPLLLMQSCGPLMAGLAALLVVGVLRRLRAHRVR